MSGADAQTRASHPRASVFVAANAGSGKTTTLVRRVARLLLDGARPEAILCVTYTKAGAAEMQRRLFETLGRWAVMQDADLKAELDRIGEGERRLSSARALFARALETPGGLKIQTIHAFCEKLLRRFPLEAGVSPGFRVLEDAAALEVSAMARDRVADLATARPSGPIAVAYDHFSVELDFARFNAMFADFEGRRSAIAAHLDASERLGGYLVEVWRRLGFAAVSSAEEIALQAVADMRFRWADWGRAAEALALGSEKTDRPLAAAMRAVGPDSGFADIWAVFCTKAGTPRDRLGTQAVDRGARAWLADEQSRLLAAQHRLVAARVAEDTVHALTLAAAYAGAYQGLKDQRGALDFADLVRCVGALLEVRADAAWVLYKLDGGVDHILLDEAQDTAPEQWDILRALTAEFFTGLGASPRRRTLFAVGDEKQSIFSFQGAAPERLAVETQTFGDMAREANLAFAAVKLLESWRTRSEILRFVDQVFETPEARAGLHPAPAGNVVGLPTVHVARRGPGGCVELWPLEQDIPGEPPDVWAPVDAEPATSAVKRLAVRLARAVTAMVARGEAVQDPVNREMRPCDFGDILILVRRRSALFHEIIRALKREGARVAGADRLKLSEHGVFADLTALARFACFPADDLTLAGLLRSPFCDLDEESLFDLAHGRAGSLWSVLRARGGERPAWASAAALLGWARAEAGAAPFDFYGRFLGRLDGVGRSLRQRLLTRLGAEGEEALDAFLGQTLEVEGRGLRDLESFVAAMAASEIEIKREAEQAGTGPGAVRVMTVHGAKGLEAPIVILPDTTSRATSQGGPLLATGDGGFLWAPRKADDCPQSAAARDDRDRAVEEESARLLYVALTRARDRLVVCGVQSQPARFERSWYDFVSRAFDEIHSRPFALDGGGEGLRYGPEPDRLAPLAPLGPQAEAVPPSWARGLAPPEPVAARLVSPSSLGDGARAPAPSPLARQGGLARFRRGDLIHGLLQRLPDLPDADRRRAAANLLAREIDLSESQRAEMVAAALGVLEDPRFRAVFGPGSRAEVALAGSAARLPVGLAVSGRVDRLLVEPHRVLVVDFKTNRPAPDDLDDVDPAYVLQMALYWAVLAEIYPGRVIEAALVWTDGPRLTPLPRDRLEEVLSGLDVRG